MLSTANDVIAGNATWSAECSDALEWLRSLPTRSVSMVLFSPPYESQRTYGVNFNRKGQVWSDWLRPIIVESARVSSGLVIVNAACPVRKWSYSPALEWLVADLTRIDGLVCGPSPYAWVKSMDDPEALGGGTPGSGSKHYQRRDWEPLYAFCLPDRLPLAWSDNTAFGRPPEYPAGGETTHRMKNGKRRGDVARIITRRVSSAEGDVMVKQNYRPPEISNPGNVVRAPVGGGHLGHPLAHESEAPMSMGIAERFVRWFVPVGGIVADPFGGSGTTLQAALEHSRKGIMCDIRESQVELTRRRLATVTLPLFT